VKCLKCAGTLNVAPSGSVGYRAPSGVRVQLCDECGKSEYLTRTGQCEDCEMKIEYCICPDDYEEEAPCSQT
jgi:hypothetical protein